MSGSQLPLSLFEDTTTCMRTLDHVQTFYVSSNENHKDDDGLTVVVDLTIELQQRQVAQPNDIFVANKDPKKHVLKRDFEEYRVLRKLVHFCIGCRHFPHSHEGDMNRDLDASQTANEDETKATACAFCAHVNKYEQFCWEQPPLIETALYLRMAAMKKNVLTNSMSYFLYLAKSPFSLPTQANPNSSTAQTQQTVQLFCQAQAELAITLYDFCRLQNYE